MDLFLTDVSVDYYDNETRLILKGRTQDLDEFRDLVGKSVEVRPKLVTSGLSQVISTASEVSSFQPYTVTASSAGLTIDNSSASRTYVTSVFNDSLSDQSEDEPSFKRDKEVYETKDMYAFKKSINACITWLLKHNYQKPIIIHGEDQFLCGEQKAILAMEKDFSNYKGLYGINTEMLVKNSRKFREQKIDRLFESIKNY